MRRGFTLIETEIGTHQSIDEQIQELRGSGADPDTGYAIFGDHVVRVADAWSADAWAMQLS